MTERTDQIDIVNITRQVMRRWFPVVMAGLIAAFVVGIAAMRLYRPTYKTQALITVYGKTSSSVVYNAKETAEVFEEIITSNLLQKKVAEEIGLTSLPGTISCSNAKNTNIITLSASSYTPQDAMITINSVLSHHQVVTDILLGDMVLQVLESPVVPTQPVEAYSEGRVLSAVFLLSVAALFAGLFLWFYLRDDIKNEHQVEQKLDTKLFATIYHEDVDKGFKIFHRKSKKKRKGILVTNPVTSFGFIETIQKICVRLEYKTKEKGRKTIVVTSVLENEGKSTVAVNMALSLAKMGKRVMLVDLDLRKPALFKLLEIPYEKDDVQIGDILTGQTDLSTALRKVEGMELYVLAGKRSYNNSARMLSGSSLQQIMKACKSVMDYIIIDTPPIDVAADAEEIIHYADAGLLVVRQNGAIVKDINDAVDIFRGAGCKLLGCVLNNVETGLLGSNLFKGEGYNYRYGYHYKHYGKYYGKRE